MAAEPLEPGTQVQFTYDYTEIDDRGRVHDVPYGKIGIVVDSTNPLGYVVTFSPAPDRMTRFNTFNFVPPEILHPLGMAAE